MIVLGLDAENYPRRTIRENLIFSIDITRVIICIDGTICVPNVMKIKKTYSMCPIVTEIFIHIFFRSHKISVPTVPFWYIFLFPEKFEFERVSFFDLITIHHMLFV